MKKYISFFAVVFFFSSINVSAQFPNRNPTPNDTLKSVQVLPGGDVVLQIYAPEAENVSVAGDIIPWGQQESIKSKKTDNGVWSFVIPKVKAGTYRYHFVVDGVQVYDPKAPDAYETSALIDVLPAGENEFFALRKDVPHGAMAEIYYYSDVTGSMRTMHIWTPPGYNAKNNKLPVFYLIHGGGDSDMAWPNVGRAGFIMDNLLSEGLCKEMIVVMPDGGMDTKAFTKELGEIIIPYVESNYNVYTDADHRALAGLSMGGLETLDAFMTYPDKFAYINVMSSGWFANNTEMFEENDKRLGEVAPTLKETVKYLIFTTGGPEDIAYENNKKVLEVFDKYGIKYTSTEMPGGHTWYVWRNDLKNFAPRLFK